MIKKNIRYKELRLKSNSQKKINNNLTKKNSKKLINIISILLIFCFVFEKK